LHAVDGNRFGAANIQTATRINGDVAIGRRIGVSLIAVAAKTGSIEVQRAACHAVIAGDSIGAVTQIDLRTAGQRQHTIAGTQFDDGPVRAVDDLAVTVDPQYRAVRIEYRITADGQALVGRQPDRADPFAAGVNRAVHGQAAVIHRDIDRIGLDFIADGQIALLQLEAAPAHHIALIEARIECGKLAVERTAAAQRLRPHFHTAGQIRHHGAAGIVVTAAATENVTLQIDHAGGISQRYCGQAARLVIDGRQIDGGTSGLADIAIATFQNDGAAPAVFIEIVERNLASGDIDSRGIAQRQILIRDQGQLAARQRHHGGYRHIRAMQSDFGTKRLIGTRRNAAPAGALNVILPPAVMLLTEPAAPVSNGVLMFRLPPLY